MVLQDANSRRAFHSVCLETRMVSTVRLVGCQYFTFTSMLLSREGKRMEIYENIREICETFL